MTAGDFDQDGQYDLAVGAPYFSLGSGQSEGRVYLFYQDAETWTNLEEACTICSAQYADVKITGNAGSYFGSALLSADFDGDSFDDLAVGSHRFRSQHGGVHIFYSQAESDQLTISAADCMEASL